MSDSPGRFPWTAVLSATLLLALFVALFQFPLRPTAWGGPRGSGPFEEGALPQAGRWARDARVHLDSLAKKRSRQDGIVATGEALVGYHALLVAAKLGVLWLILYRVGRRGWLATLFTLVVALPMFLEAPRQTERDVGLVLFTILMAATTCSRPPWWLASFALPAFFAFWANAHASALLGLIWLGIIILGRTLEWSKAVPGSTRPAVFRFLISIVLCAAAMCANPDGPRIFVDAVLAMKNTNIYSLPDYQPMDLSSKAGLPWLYFGSVAILVLLQIVGSRPFSPTILCLVLSFGIWPLVQQRGMDYWWLIVAWIAVSEISAAMDWKPGSQSVSEWDTVSPHSASERASKFGRLRWVIVAAFLVAFLATPFMRWIVFGKPRELESIVTPDTPILLVHELVRIEALPEFRETVNAEYPGGRYRGAILCGEDQGDFLAWVLEDESHRPVMTYNRPETLGKEHWSDCRRVLDGFSDWWEITGRHQVNLIAIDPKRHPKLAERLRRAKEWRTVQDDSLLIAVRHEPRLPVELMKP